MKSMYHVSASPHIRSSVTTATIMRDVAIALIPASLLGVYQFGFNAFLVLVTSIVTCVLAEYLYKKLMKKPGLPYESSAIVTGLLLGMNLPSTVPLWIPIIGGVFAIIIVKELYGGLGQNFMNPALAARCFLLISFAGRMTAFGVSSFNEAQSSVTKNLYTFLNGAGSLDGISSATPLAQIKTMEAAASVADVVSLKDMFLGFTGGVIGETSILALLIGAAYLVFRKVISLRIPLIYIGSFVVFLLLFGGHGFDLYYIAAEVCGGGLILGAFFMATDYVTSPITKTGQVIFGVLLGLLTVLFRVFGNNAEGVSFAIIFCNLLVPLLDKYTVPVAFGKGGRKNGK